MKIAVLIPDRGDRPQLTENCLRMMDAQTLQPALTVRICDPPSDDMCDITKRYRIGYDLINRHGKVDLIALIENDDWYDPHYLEFMAKAWEAAGRPQIFGTNYTIYYHLKLRRWWKFEHFDRASAMNTFIVPGLKIHWPNDVDPYTDIHLWMHCGLRGQVIDPQKEWGRHISIGMKHNIGKAGGDFHGKTLQMPDYEQYFKNEDGGLMRNTLDPVSFEFYDNLFLL